MEVETRDDVFRIVRTPFFDENIAHNATCLLKKFFTSTKALSPTGDCNSVNNGRS